jgi:hypothetical protein
MKLARFLILLVCCAGAQAGTILERRIEIEVKEPHVLTSEELLVEIDRPGDNERWGRYPIYLDKNIDLVRCTAEVLDSRGKVLKKIPRRQHHRLESPGSDLYSSEWASIIPFPPLTVGQRLRINYATKTRPYFPATGLPLVQGAMQKMLTVSIRHDGEELRWRINPDASAFVVDELPNGLTITGKDIPRYSRPAYAPEADTAFPFLWLAWGGEQTWTDVGVWYEGLLADVPRDDPEVDALAKRLTEGLTAPREKVEALSNHVRRKIRYEAVEIGVGGFVPTPAAEVLQRAWGDCKDKAALLADLLAAVDIPSHLVLLRAGHDGAFVNELACPCAFNHAILGIPAERAGAVPGDPVAEDLLLIDPTWERGTLSWLAAADRGRDVLVVDGTRSRLLRIPAQPSAETGVLEVTGSITPWGELKAHVRMTLTGTIAIPWLEDLATKSVNENEADFRRVMGFNMAGSRLSDIRWEPSASVAPSLTIEAELVVPRLVRGDDARRVLRATGLTVFPEARVLDDRQIPVVLTPTQRRTLWRLQLPSDWCPALAVDDNTENHLGHVRTTVANETGNVVTVLREAEIRRSRVDPGEFEALGALSVAESRADRRQIRLRCPEEP